MKQFINEYLQTLATKVDMPHVISRLMLVLQSMYTNTCGTTMTSLILW